jgi:cysteine desulfurase/selenocysteine lyase
LQLRSINGVRIYGPSPEAAAGRAALATFNVEGIHPTDISTILDSVRSAPLHRHQRLLGVRAMDRSLATRVS